MSKKVMLLRKFQKMSYEELLQYCKKENGLVHNSYNKAESKENFWRHHDFENIKASGYAGYETERPENLTWADFVQHLFLHSKITNRSDASDATLAVYKLYGRLLTEVDLNKNKYYADKYDLTPNSEAYLFLENYIKEITANRTANFTHNASAFAQLIDYYKNNNRAYVKITTGGGKTPFGITTMLYYNCNSMVLCPQTIIKEGWDRTTEAKEGRLSVSKDKLIVKTYQSIYASYETFEKEILDNNIKLIICDEAHHILANRWGTNIDRLISEHPEIKLLGLTATDELKDTASNQQLTQFNNIFRHQICGIDLNEGITKGIIWPIQYKIGLMDNEIREKQLAQFHRLMKCLDIPEEIKNANVLPIKARLENMPIMEDSLITGIDKTRPLKAIVFIDRLELLEHRKKQILDIINKLFNLDPGFKNINSDFYVAEMYSRNSGGNEFISDKQNSEIAEKFNNVKSGILFVKDMAKEGFHPENINTLIMLRSTGSQILYKQQLGRVVRLVKDAIDPKCQVFDFVDNYNQVRLVDMFEYNKSLNRLRKELNRRERVYSKASISDEEKLQNLIASCEDALIGIQEITTYQKTLQDLDAIVQGYGYKSTTLPIGTTNDPNNNILKTVYSDIGEVENKNLLIIGNWRIADDLAKKNNVYIITDCPEYYEGVNCARLFSVNYDIKARTGKSDKKHNECIKLYKEDQIKWIELGKKKEVINGVIKELIDMNKHFDLIIANPPYNIGNQIISSVVDKAEESIVLMPFSCYKKNNLYKHITSIELVDPRLFEDAQINANLNIARLCPKCLDQTYEDLLFETFDEPYRDYYRLNSKYAYPFTRIDAPKDLSIIDLKSSFLLTWRSNTDGVHKTESKNPAYDVKWNILNDRNLLARDGKPVRIDPATKAYDLYFIIDLSEKQKQNIVKFWYYNSLNNSLILAQNNDNGLPYYHLPRLNWSKDRDYENCTLDDIMNWLKEDNNL